MLSDQRGQRYRKAAEENDELKTQVDELKK